ncbi:hypothetical protein AcW1_004577 [Taiwanofungus camphoratus]|nr:hypothetical protein AcW1_004577 [Antrodia cinnamomea]
MRSTNTIPRVPDYRQSTITIEPTEYTLPRKMISKQQETVLKVTLRHLASSNKSYTAQSVGLEQAHAITDLQSDCNVKATTAQSSLHTHVPSPLPLSEMRATATGILETLERCNEATHMVCEPHIMDVNEALPHRDPLCGATPGALISGGHISSSIMTSQSISATPSALSQCPAPTAAYTANHTSVTGSEIMTKALTTQAPTFSTASVTSPQFTFIAPSRDLNDPQSHKQSTSRTKSQPIWTAMPEQAVNPMQKADATKHAQPPIASADHRTGHVFVATSHSVNVVRPTEALLSKSAKRRRIELNTKRKPPKRLGGLGVQMASDWTNTIRDYLRLRSRRGTAVPGTHVGPDSRKRWLALKQVMIEIEEARNNVSVEVVKESGIGSAIKRFAFCRTDETWGEEALAFRKKAKEIYDSWYERLILSKANAAHLPDT